MSVKKITLSLFVVAFIGCSYFIFKTKTTPQPIHTFAKYERSNFVGRGASDRVIKVKVKAQTISEKNDTAEIVAHISLPFDHDASLKYKWTLGQSVSLVEGSLENEVSNLKQDQTQTVKILVRGFNKSENRHIGFEIYGQRNGRVISSDSLIASQRENTFENIVQNVERIKAERKD